MIEITDLEFHYGEGDFSLAVNELAITSGQTVAVVGPSGSGKTTLLNLIAGVLQPARGTVRVDGIDLARLNDAARRAHRIARMGLVFQEFELLEYLDALDNILLPCRIGAGLQLDRQVRERARALAAQVGVADRLSRFPDQLSQGERQRVAVCRALLVQPALLLADEPTGNLDFANKDRVLDILFDYVAGSGATLVTVTHDRDMVTRFDHTIDVRTFVATADSSVAETAA